jgi:hypothetical protein
MRRKHTPRSARQAPPAHSRRAARRITTTWQNTLAHYATAFTAPSFRLFAQLLTAWLLCTGRRTVTGMLRLIAPPQRHAHDAYHRLLRTGAWEMARLWRLLVETLLAFFSAGPDRVVPLDLDDTLFHKAGRRVNGAGTFRDAVRSSAKHVVYAWGLNLVVLTLRVQAPWGGEPLGLPINVRVYRKGGKSHAELAEAMIRELADWFPQRRFHLCADGAYACLAGCQLPRTHFTSRLRRDAALFEMAPPRRKGRRGRPRKKGRRLPTPEQLAARVRPAHWQRTVIDLRGHPVERLLHSQTVLWYHTCPDHLVRLVIVRDPDGKQPDDFFFTTDITAHSSAVATQYAGRWSIEDTFRNTKQYLGGEHPQCWKGQGPERAAALSLWLSSVVWLCYIAAAGASTSWVPLPWYPMKRTPSFIDALATLRRALWSNRIFSNCAHQPLSPKFLAPFIDALAYAT